jgi:transmembrane sensor
MSFETPDNRSGLFDEAAEWLIRIRENPQSEKQLRAQFEAWRQKSPQHEKAWNELCLLWRATGQAEPLYRQLASTRAAAPRQARISAPRWAAGLAVAVTVACGIWLAAPSAMIHWTADHRTAIAEIQTIRLEDGSSVQLAPDSALSVQFTGEFRQVTLLQGEAYFDVQKSPDRPFRVIAGSAEVEVLGTAFDVQLTGKATRVAVARGSVSAFSRKTNSPPSPATLKPGDAVSIDAVSGMQTTEVVDVDNVGAWREGRLVVRNASIASVIDVIRRYDPAWISLADPSLGEERVTGIYDLTSPALALGALVDPFGGKVRNIGETLRVITRH